jgi:hypothetical protein
MDNAEVAKMFAELAVRRGGQPITQSAGKI